MTTLMSSDAPIFVAGHGGLVGSAVLRRLEREGFTNVLTATRDQLDLRDQAAVNYWFRANRPEFVFLVAGFPPPPPRGPSASGGASVSTTGSRGNPGPSRVPSLFLSPLP